MNSSAFSWGRLLAGCLIAWFPLELNVTRLGISVRSLRTKILKFWGFLETVLVDQSHGELGSYWHRSGLIEERRDSEHLGSIVASITTGKLDVLSLIVRITDHRAGGVCMQDRELLR